MLLHSSLFSPARTVMAPGTTSSNGDSNCGGSVSVRYGSREVAGFSLDGANDPAATLSSDQQVWVVSALANLNTQIGQSTGTSCAGWQDPGTNLAAAVGCFQLWANANGKGSLRMDGVLDQDTLNVLLSVTAAHAVDFPTPFPAAPPMPPPPVVLPSPVVTPASPTVPTVPTVPEPPPVSALTVTDKLMKKWSALSTGAKIGVGAGAAVVVGGSIGGVVYYATKKKRASTAGQTQERRRRRRKGRR